MILTISGTPGSGKSTIAKILVEKFLAEKLSAEKMVVERIYVGGIRRELAKQKGMTLEQLNEYAKTHPETDVDVDLAAAAEARAKEGTDREKTERLGEGGQDDLSKMGKIVIVEGRTQYHFLPESIKIYVKCDFEEGAKRIWKDMQNTVARAERNEGNINSLEDTRRDILRRQNNDAERYQKYYNINPYDESQYDLVVDTTRITAMGAAERILTYLKSRKSL